MHEAFAGMVAFDPELGIVVAKAPPDAIDELPPQHKPVGANVAWIPGYWAWDEDSNDRNWKTNHSTQPPSSLLGCGNQLASDFRDRRLWVDPRTSSIRMSRRPRCASFPDPKVAPKPRQHRRGPEAIGNPKVINPREKLPGQPPAAPGGKSPGKPNEKPEGNPQGKSAVKPKAEQPKPKAEQPKPNAEQPKPKVEPKPQPEGELKDQP
jgi:hypothetical protein